jgi:GT2 family glycosyltransferase
MKQVSIIIVHYNVFDELCVCISSILQSKPKTSYEIIVVDNDKKPTIQKQLKKKFPQVKYINGQGNVGFGQANNLGVKIAKGKFLFFLNPDTKVFKNTLDNLVQFLQKHKRAGIVAPLLANMDGEVYQQGSLTLTPLRGIASLSLFHRIFPQNPTARRYYLHDWNKKTIKEVDVVPGTAFLIRKEIFEQIKGFDKNFFLYFEEFDLCKRVKALGWEIFITPVARINHVWGASTKKLTNVNKIFNESRYYYFKKHFGIVNALLTEAFLRIGKFELSLLCVLIAGAFFRLDGIDKSMVFLGDQGWFYLSARDMLLTGTIPLVGIASSHPWLHQGALWTYLLAGFLWIFKFNPLSGVYLTVLFETGALILLYKLGTLFFSKKVGLLAATLYATSPLIIGYARMPYHTSLISFFTIIFLYMIYLWIKGKLSVFPWIIFLLGILYNLELATFLLTVIVCGFLLYGSVKRKQWVLGLFTKRIISFSILAFFISMLPMLLYDMSHGFVQTVGFILWLVYKGLSLFGLFSITETNSSLSTMLTFFITQNNALIFPYSNLIAISLSFASFFYLISYVFKKNTSAIIITVINIFIGFAIFLGKVPSDAYLPLLFPSLILQLAYFFDALLRQKLLRFFTLVFLLCFFLFNIHFLVTHHYSVLSNFDSYAKRLAAAQYVVKESEKKEYNLRGEGIGSEFASYTMNYEYLTWWLGNGPSKTTQPVQFIIKETPTGIQVKKDTKK